MPTSLIGRTLAGRYDVHEVIGDGGMAVVYRGRDILLDRVIAIKVLRKQFSTDEEFLNRFRLEARSAASLSHAHVVNIYDVGDEDGLHFIVMEYVEGENLKQLISRDGPIPVDQAIVMTVQIAEALEAAHGRGLIHRDVKPHNILITKDQMVKVTDFGIARAPSVASFTMTGTVIGSVHYFSPEQARGDVVDQATDIYSLGVVMYEMLTGQLPFTGESVVAVALKHLQEEPPLPGDVVDGIPKSVERIVMRLLQKEKRNRYQSVTELLRSLRMLLPVYGRQRMQSGHEASSLRPAGKQKTSETLVSQRDRQTDRANGEARPSHRLNETKVYKGETITTGDQGREESPVPGDGTRKKGRRWPILILLFMLFFVGGVMTVTVIPDLIFPGEVDVPDVIGLDIAEAKLRLERVKLRLKEDGRTFHPEIERGKILHQTPEGSHRVRMGREIKVVVSGGPERVIVPNLQGETKITAQLLITQERLTLGEVREEYMPDLPPNTIIEQHPPAGERVVSGEPVDIVVSRDQERLATVRMPNVRGMTLSDAQKMLDQLGFVEGMLHGEPHPTAEVDEVFDQNPEVGEEVEIGYPYSLAYAVPYDTEEEAALPAETPPEDKHWENTLLITVPEGPSQEIVIVVIDDWGPRQVLREVRKGGSRFYHTMRLRGDLARIQVWFDGEEQMNRQLRRPGASF